MSQSSLLKFLGKLDKELSANSSEYRSVNANKRAHIFRFTSSKFAKQVKIQAAAQGIPLTNKDLSVINKQAEDLLGKLKAKLNRVQAENKKIVSGKTYVRMTFTSSTKVYSKFGDPDSIYHKIYNSYRPLLKKTFEEIQKYLHTQEFTNPTTGRKKSKAIRTKSGKTREAAGQEIQLGHIEGKSVVESFIRDAFENVLDNEGAYTDSGDALSETDIRREMKNLGIDISIIKNARINTYTVELESAKDNREGGKVLKARKRQLQAQIKKAIKNLGGIENLKGSDTPKEVFIKKTRKEVLDPFKNKKHITVKGKSTKTDNKSAQAKRSSKARAKRAKTSIQSLGKAALPAKLKARKTKGASSAAQPLQLLAMLNKQLPDTVRKNMREPALVNRSGRFADSVRATDVTQTPKGYPSIGYTYDRSPYGVFEDGAGIAPWANGDRDPRDLIDKSIREIATQFAIGRFYTRRV